MRNVFGSIGPIGWLIMAFGLREGYRVPGAPPISDI
jgi:hypothetical protein